MMSCGPCACVLLTCNASLGPLEAKVNLKINTIMVVLLSWNDALVMHLLPHFCNNSIMVNCELGSTSSLGQGPARLLGSALNHETLTIL